MFLYLVNFSLKALWTIWKSGNSQCALLLLHLLLLLLLLLYLSWPLSSSMAFLQLSVHWTKVFGHEHGIDIDTCKSRVHDSIQFLIQQFHRDVLSIDSWRENIVKDYHPACIHIGRIVSDSDPFHHSNPNECKTINIATIKFRKLSSSSSSSTYPNCECSRCRIYSPIWR